jgi:hypothetical protein
MISDEEALKKLTEDCDKCPNCGSDDLSVGDYEGDGLNAASSCHCNDCGMEWTEEYKLYSVTITKGPDYGEVDEPDEPQEEDLVTDDHQRFFRDSPRISTKSSGSLPWLLSGLRLRFAGFNRFRAAVVFCTWWFPVAPGIVEF